MIEVNNLTRLRVNKRFLKKIAQNTLLAQKSGKDLSIAIVNSEEIRRLNKKYRKKDKPTDVLSFDYGESGEVVLCLEQIEGSMAEVLVHGILHILGYNHKQMKNLQK